MVFPTQKLTINFNPEAKIPLEMKPSVFLLHSEERFNSETASNIYQTLTDLGLPIPSSSKQLLSATEGVLLFLNRYGLVIRIEGKTCKLYNEDMQRIDDSPWVIEPIASIDVGKAIIEICPGGLFTDNEKYNNFIDEALMAHNIWYRDSSVRNIMLLPIASPQFKEGLPIVCDRLAVEHCDNPMNEIIDSRYKQNKVYLEIAKDHLYKPLKQKFAGVLTEDKSGIDPIKAHMFFALCRQYVAEGKLVAGWDNADTEDYRFDKARGAKRAGRAYEVLLQSIEQDPAKPKQIKPSSVLANHQSPHQPVLHHG